jgi:hypothetical protein
MQRVSMQKGAARNPEPIYRTTIRIAAPLSLLAAYFTSAWNESPGNFPGKFADAGIPVYPIRRQRVQNPISSVQIFLRMLGPPKIWSVDWGAKGLRRRPETWRQFLATSSSPRPLADGGCRRHLRLCRGAGTGKCDGHAEVMRHVADGRISTECAQVCAAPGGSRQSPFRG